MSEKTSKKKHKKTSGFDGAGKSLQAGNIIGALVTLFAFAIILYLCKPAFTVFSPVFWLLLMLLCLFLTVATLTYKGNEASFNTVSKLCFAGFVLVALVLSIGGFLSTPIVAADKYAKRLIVQDGDFATDIVETESINDIAIMDTQTACIIGDRAIGSLTDIVSQFEVSADYSQIDYNGKPMKIAPLEYAGLIKYFNNKQSGIPGYVMVNPVSNEATYVKLDKPMKYTPSAFFNDNLARHLRFRYPTYMFSEYSFELDAEGNPYYVCPVIRTNAGLFGARDVAGVVICNPCDGSSQYYAAGDVPNWVDRVYDGDLLEKKFDWYGTLSGGFWNSVFGNKGCKKTTDDYGYKVIDGDVWVYTGVTSVNGDESNIGFVLMNERTAEAKYYQIAGAKEYSAMSSAQGEVQHLGYQASFPSLINIGGEPTYIMAMKDEAGLVKLYALVNVAKYNIVATGSTQRDALSSYKKLMKANGIQTAAASEDNAQQKRITIAELQYINVNGETYVYIKDREGNAYKQMFAENEDLILLNAGDSVLVKYENADAESQIYNLISYEK